MRALLIQWSESILDIPTLVRLGYGGVPSPFVDRDIDDISSWGGDNDDDDLEVEDNPGRRQISARSKLITRILNAVMRGQSVSLTEEEKDIIAQLSVTETAIRPSPQSRSNPGVEASASGDFRERLLNTEKNAVSIPEMSLDALSDLRKDPPPQRESDRISHRQKTQKDPTLGMQRKGTTKSLIIKAQHNPKTCNQPSDSDSSDKEARRVVKVSRRLLARQLNESESDCEAKAHQAPKNTALGPDSDSGSRGGVRRVVKASRRLMAKAPYESESELESRKPAAKRKRYEKTGRDESGDDDSSLDAPVMKLSRRIRNWASSERQSKRMRTTPTEEEDSLKENNQPMNTGETSKESATRLQWSGSEGETTPIHRQKESTAYSPTKRYAFTEEETAAIRDGVFRFGVGHWKTIQENDARLRHRTNEQVKDKFRTMKNRGEI